MPEKVLHFIDPFPERLSEQHLPELVVAVFDAVTSVGEAKILKLGFAECLIGFLV